ncbi:MAG: 2-phospho-L-lactate transferase [Candidatus Methanofastidiosia archaeon]
MMLTIFSGGTGTPKLLIGMARVVNENKLCVVTNTAEDLWISGTYLSPDTDSVVYALAGIIDEDKWYGISGDTFHTFEAMQKLGYEEMLKMGDRDRATKIYRTLRLKAGAKLSEVTDEICHKLGVKTKVFPMTDDKVETFIETGEKKLRFHEFWVRDRGRHKVKDVEFLGSKKAKITDGIEKMAKRSSAIVIGPSNPITSILPILSIKKIRKLCEEQRTIVVSPMIGNSAFSGPAAVLMAGLGYPTNSLGVARIYNGIADEIIIDRKDRSMADAIEDMGIKVHLADIYMKDLNNRISLGKFICDLTVVT